MRSIERSEMVIGLISKKQVEAAERDREIWLSLFTFSNN